MDTRDMQGRRAIQRRVRSGELLEIRHGLFARPDYWNALPYWDRIMHVLRAVSARHPRWVLCGVSAAAVWRLNATYLLHDRVHVAVDVSNKSSDRGCLRFHYIADPQTVVCNGIPVTGLMQTVFDCMRSLPFAHALTICDAALRDRGLDADDMARFLDTRRGCAGIARARRIWGFADGRSENGGESTLRAWLIERGYAIPDLQRWVDDPVSGSRYRVDFAWDLPGGGVVALELDGREKYVNPSMVKGGDAVGTVLAEKERESNILLGDGIRIVRVSFRELTDAPWAVSRKLELAGVPHAEAPVIPGVPANWNR